MIDGTGFPCFRADVGIKGGRIAKVGKIDRSEARTVIDAEGLVVSPGFVDIHSHADFGLSLRPTADNLVLQGVTTVLVGNCGVSLAPISRGEKPLMEYLSPFIPPGFDVEWETFAEYLRYYEGLRPSINVAHLVGHSTVRMAVMGFDDRDPTPEELRMMASLVREAMEAGAFGMSTGLIYPPGAYASTEEIIELAGVVSPYDGLYATHMRSESFGLIRAVEEAITIGERANVRVQISHHKAAGRSQWGLTEKTLSMMEEARRRGIDVACDVYPYTASLTSGDALLPPWASEGGLSRLVDRLEDPQTRERIRKEIEGSRDWENIVASAGWENVVVASVRSEENSHLVGRSLLEVARLTSKDSFDALCDLLIQEEGALEVLTFEMNEEDVLRVLAHPLSMVGSDSSVDIGRGRPHPRDYGTYPRVLRYAQERRVLRLEEAVRKMTSIPAERIGLHDRGLVREGMWADLVIFDPERVEDRATYQDPRQYPEGISYVIVNGKIVVEEGEHTGTRAGRVLYRS